MSELKGCSFCLNGERDMLVKAGHYVEGKGHAIYIVGTHSCWECYAATEAREWCRENIDPIMAGVEAADLEAA